MPKKKELTREEQVLFSELKKLSKRANQRIVRLEREFGKDTWATKYLKEKLATEPLQAWTVSGRSFKQDREKDRCIPYNLLSPECAQRRCDRVCLESDLFV